MMHHLPSLIATFEIASRVLFSYKKPVKKPSSAEDKSTLDAMTREGKGGVYQDSCKVIRYRSGCVRLLKDSCWFSFLWGTSRRVDTKWRFPFFTKYDYRFLLDVIITIIATFFAKAIIAISRLSLSILLE
jgi:hypothetical protein